MEVRGANNNYHHHHHHHNNNNNNNNGKNLYCTVSMKIFNSTLQGSGNTNCKVNLCLIFQTSSMKQLDYELEISIA